MRTIYRAEPVRALFCLGLGGLFAASSGSMIATVGVSPASIFPGLLAGIIIGVAGCILLTRVAVDGSGLEKRAPFDGSFRASWDEIESWWVHRGCIHQETLPQACFRLRDRRRCGVVQAADAWRPSFDAFLQDVRARVGDRETAEPRAAHDRTGE
jgi:hypothetical protein